MNKSEQSIIVIQMSIEMRYGITSRKNKMPQCKITIIRMALMIKINNGTEKTPNTKE